MSCTEDHCLCGECWDPKDSKRVMVYTYLKSRTVVRYPIGWVRGEEE